MGRELLTFDSTRPVAIYWGEGQSVAYDSIDTLSSSTGVSKKAVFRAIETGRHVLGWSFRVKFADGMPIDWFSEKTGEADKNSLIRTAQPVVAIFPDGEEITFPSKLAAGQAVGISYSLISQCIRQNKMPSKHDIWFIDPSQPRPESPPAGFVFEK